MFVTSAVSNLGGWAFLREHPSGAWRDLVDVAAGVVFDPYEPRELFGRVHALLGARGWSVEPRVAVAGRPRPSGIDAVKAAIALDVFGFVKGPVLDRKLFVRYPFLVRAFGLDCVVAMVPEPALGPKGFGAYANPRSVRATFSELGPATLKYRFVVLGIGPEPAEPAVAEVSSEIDSYLIGEFGTSLAEMTAVGEQPHYDFKVVPQDAEDTGKSACGFANHPGGGALLVGVADDGSLAGVPRAKADEYQLAVIQAIRDTCSPPPGVDTKLFPLADDPTRCIIVVRVHELPEKPCVHRDVVRIRVGASTRAAKPHEIRRIVLGLPAEP